MKGNDNKQDRTRREFLKRLGTTSASAFLLGGFGVQVYADDKKKAAKKTDGERSMTFRINKHTEDKVSLLGYGMMRLPQVDGHIDQEMVNKEVDYALAHGVNYFDTAPVYIHGQSEVSTGIALHRHPRNSYYVATKLSDMRDHSLEAGQKMFKTSLERLQVDYIDYYLLHSVGGGKGMDTLNDRFINNGLLDWLCEQRDKGLIRNLGFSYHGDVKVFDWLLDNNKKYGFTFVQIEMNYIDWRHAGQGEGWKKDADAEYLYQKCERMGVQNVVMEPLLGGRLAKVPSEYEELMRAADPDDTPAKWAFRWVGSHENILTTLSGMTTMEVLQENVETFSPLQEMSEEEFDLMDRIATGMKGIPVIPCTACQYCMPCPFGVNIPGNFAVYNNAVNSGSFPKKGEDSYKKKVKALRDSFKKKLKSEELATKCMECGQCLPKCPQSIRIPNQMMRIVELIGEK